MWGATVFRNREFSMSGMGEVAPRKKVFEKRETHLRGWRFVKRRDSTDGSPLTVVSERSLPLMVRRELRMPVASRHMIESVSPLLFKACFRFYTHNQPR